MNNRSIVATLLLVAALANPVMAVEADPVEQAKVCTTLGKVHALRDRQLYTVAFQSIDGQLSARRSDACIMLTAGEHVLGLVSATEVAAFPRRRAPRGAQQEQTLALTVEPRRTYTIAAQLDDRREASWIPVVQRVELWQ